MRGERVVAHTLQPHYPHITSVGGAPAPVPGGPHPRIHEIRERHLQSVLANGNISINLARRSYRASVRFAWKRAIEFAGELVQDSFTVAVTADHGESFGELGFVEHPVDIPIRELTDVPWVVCSPPMNVKSYDPPSTVDERFSDLGYRV